MAVLRDFRREVGVLVLFVQLLQPVAISLSVFFHVRLRRLVDARHLDRRPVDAQKWCAPRQQRGPPATGGHYPRNPVFTQHQTELHADLDVAIRRRFAEMPAWNDVVTAGQCDLNLGSLIRNYDSRGEGASLFNQATYPFFHPLFEVSF